jgi:hypothetical protein
MNLYEENELFYKYERLWEANTKSHYDLSFIKSFLESKYLKKNSSQDADGNIVISSGDRNKICFCAHMDTVFKSNPYPIYDNNKGIITSINQYGIGGDDKCGIIISIELLKFCVINNISCKVVLFSTEESGGVGAKEIDLKVFDDVSHIVEVDRKGYNEVIRVSGSTDLCNEDYIKEFSDFKIEYGIFTDVNILKSRGLNKNCVNISAGYYSPHGDKEYVSTQDMTDIIYKLRNFSIKTTGKVYKDHVYIKQNIGNQGHFWHNYSIDDYEEYYRYDNCKGVGKYKDNICDNCGKSEIELGEKFKFNPDFYCLLCSKCSKELIEDFCEEYDDISEKDDSILAI